MDEVSEYQIIERAKYLKSHGKRVVAKYIKDYLNIDYSSKAVINALKREDYGKPKHTKRNSD